MIEIEGETLPPSTTCFEPSNFSFQIYLGFRHPDLVRQFLSRLRVALGMASLRSAKVICPEG